MALKIVRNNIAEMDTEAIVNTANYEPIVGIGCDMEIHNKAGLNELLEYRIKNIGIKNEGDAFITPGFNLKSKYIIHAISPLYMGGGNNEEEKLRMCYKNSLKLAKENNIKSISFPLISSGEFSYPKEEAIRIAIEEINEFILNYDIEVFIVVFDECSTMLSEKLYPDLKAYIDNNYEGDSSDYNVFEYTYNYKSNNKNNRLKPIKRMIINAIAPIDFEDDINDRINDISNTYSEYLLYLIGKKNMENSEVYKRAIIDKKLFSKIKNNKNYHPNKMTALCLCIGAKLTLEESKDLLSRAGYALSPCDKIDIIFSYFIENQIYDMIEIDIQLEEHGLPCIIV